MDALASEPSKSMKGTHATVGKADVRRSPGEKVSVRRSPGEKVTRQGRLSGRDLFLRMKSCWMSRTLIDDTRPELGSWLEERIRCRSSDWGIGCRLCREGAATYPTTIATRLSKWTAYGVVGKSIKWHNIARHVVSPQHARLVQAKGGSGAAALGPPLDDWHAVLAGKRKGCTNMGVLKVACAEKVHRMSWCLAEAAKELEQRRLSTVECLALHQDAREGVLMVYYTGIDVHLRRFQGALGIAKDYGTKAKDICHATLAIIKSFCTTRLFAPRPSDVQPVFDEALYEHVKAITELLGADGAADEQRAARLLTGNVANDDKRETLPNVKLIMRDRTHAATRCLPAENCHMDI